MQPAIAQMSLIEEFTAAATQAVASVQLADRSPRALCNAILQAVGDAPRILYAPPHELPAELFSEFAADPRVRANPTPEEMVGSAAGVTEAFAAVASTGSVCIDVSFERTGMVSLLAPLQVAVVAAETIVPQPRDLFRADVLGGRGLERDFAFVTGPSATADMGPLVRGVHGPHRLHIIVLR
ncbi:MAG TPA: LUD domain-containing protein [Candidatus Binatia bacterium]|nr:LUD domain-containing protein [Candidatus Binatia bacterium]